MVWKKVTRLTGDKRQETGDRDRDSKMAVGGVETTTTTTTTAGGAQCTVGGWDERAQEW